MIFFTIIGIVMMSITIALLAFVLLAIAFDKPEED